MLTPLSGRLTCGAVEETVPIVSSGKFTIPRCLPIVHVHSGDEPQIQLLAQLNGRKDGKATSMNTDPNSTLKTIAESHEVMAGMGWMDILDSACQSR